MKGTIKNNITILGPLLIHYHFKIPDEALSPQNVEFGSYLESMREQNILLGVL